MVNIFCIIPARGGSKGIKNKNIKLLNRIPLVDYTLKFAEKYLNHATIILSSDKKKILNRANNYQNIIKSYRPKKLATDKSLIFDVVKYELFKAEKKFKKKYDIILLLQPTCPFRKVSDLKKILSKMKNSKYDSAVSICEVGALHPERMKIFKNGFLKNYTSKIKENMRPRQDLKKIYIRSGGYYIIKRSSFIKYNSLVGKYCSGVVVNGKYNINIDNKYDFILAQNIN